MKRLLSMLCAVTVAMTMAAMPVGAADPAASASGTAAPQSASTTVNPNEYQMAVVDGQIQFWRNGKEVGRFPARQPVALTLFTGKTGELQVLFYQADGTLKNITLKDQKHVRIDGTAEEIRLDKSLSPAVTVSLAPTAAVKSLRVESAGKVSVAGNLENVMVTGASSVTIQPAAAVDKLQVADKNARVTAEKGAAVKSAATVNKTTVSGVSSVAIMPSATASALKEGASAGSAVKLPSTIGGGNKSSGGSSSGGGSSGSGGGGNNNSYIPPETPDTPSEPDVTILGVYPNLRAATVRVELNRAVPLDKSAFSVTCPTGKDMTVLNVTTVSGKDVNRIYDLSTAYYTENTYYMNITLPNGTEISKKFVVDAQIPMASNVTATRHSGDTAAFSFVADDAGKVYYMLVKTLARAGDTPPTTAQEVKDMGVSQDIEAGLNEIPLTGLESGAAYAIYFILTDMGSTHLSDLQPPVTLAPESTTPPSQITAEAFQVPGNHEIKVVLSEPAPLTIDDFYVTCPGQADLHLGTATTEDNQTYQLALQTGYFYRPGNHYTVHIKLPGGEIEASFYAETYPTISAMTVKRLSNDGTILVTFRSDKSGYIYYGTGTSKPKADTVLRTGTKADLRSNENQLEITNVPDSHTIFYMVQTSKSGIAAAYVESEPIPAEIAEPDTPANNEIMDIQVSDGFPGTSLKVTLKEVVELYGFTVTDFTVSGDYDGRIAVMGLSPAMGLESTFTLDLNVPLSPGDYTLSIRMPNENKSISKDFTVH